MYVANVPAEAAPSSGSDDEDKPEEVSESAEAIGRVALAHADTVVSLRRDYGVPAVVGCLRNPEGQNALGAAVRFARVSFGLSTPSSGGGFWILSLISLKIPCRLDSVSAIMTKHMHHENSWVDEAAPC